MSSYYLWLCFISLWTRVVTQGILFPFDDYQIQPTINISNAVFSEPKELKITIPPQTFLKVKTVVPEKTAFVLVQSHSFLHQLNLYLKTIKEEFSSGANTGAVVFAINSSIEFTVQNNNSFQVLASIFMTPYGIDSPVPGGCASDDLPEPIIHLNVSQNVITLSAAPAGLMGVLNTCDITAIKYKLFYMYTAERDFTFDTYSDGIKTFVSPESMEKSGYKYTLSNLKVNENGTISVTFANYPGNGLVLGLIAESAFGSSSYVIQHSFGCNYGTDPNSCYYLESTFQRVLIIVICVVGLILCFCGFEWKTFELYITIFLVSALITYTGLYAACANFGIDNIIIATVVGLVIGFGILICITVVRFIHFRHCFPFLNLSFLMASVILFKHLGNSESFKNEGLYWSTLVAIAFTVFCLLYLNRSTSHYLTTTIIGSYLALLPLDYFAGTSLKFIIFDNIRRLTVPNFMNSFTDPPFQTPDYVLSVFWVILPIVCAVYQAIKHNVRKINILNSTMTSTDGIPTGVYNSFDESSPLLHPVDHAYFYNHQ